MTITALQDQFYALLAILTGWFTSPQFYAQVGAVIIAVALAHIGAKQIQVRTGFFRDEPAEGPLLKLRHWVYLCRDLLFPILAVLALAIAVEAVKAAVGTDWLVRLAQSAAVVAVLYAAIQRFIRHPLINALCRWVGLPVAALQVFTYLDETTAFLDGIAFEAGV